MEKTRLRTPFFVVNPKGYLFGEKALDLAIKADELSEKYDIDIIFTVQHVDVSLIKSKTRRLIISTQHMAGIYPGRGMGYVLPDALAEAGVQATFLNHAEHSMKVEELVVAIERANELGIITIVCANSLKEAEVLATLNPDIMVCEPTELIGTGKTSDLAYMKDTTKAVKALNPDTFVLQAAGISKNSDVKKALDSGADATGGTSGIVCGADPKAILAGMIETVDLWRKEKNK